MRIRRYAARLLSSSGSATTTTTTTNPSSPPPQPGASWLHAADDDCCDFCDLTRSAPQEAPDVVKHKGHIAGRVPESEVKSGERVDLAQLPPAPEAKKCKIDHGPPVNVAAVGLGVTKGDSAVREAEETVAGAVQPSQYDAEDVDGSVNSTSSGPVRAKGPTAEGGVAHDRSVTPSVSCVLDVVARSIGRSGRTDVICYSRRRGKRKVGLLEVKTENIELGDGVICDQCEEEETLERAGPCESVMSSAGSADVKLADIKRELMDNSAASKVKKMKKNRFECDIDYCRMTFKTKTEFSVHKKNICTVKSCSRHFRSHKYLRRHQSVHNDDMPYKCPWEGCSTAFKWSWDRAEHFKIHIGEKPYKCTTPGCSKIYKYVSDFTRHRRRCKPQR